MGDANQDAAGHGFYAPDVPVTRSHFSMPHSARHSLNHVTPLIKVYVTLRNVSVEADSLLETSLGSVTPGWNVTQGPAKHT